MYDFTAKLVSGGLVVCRFTMDHSRFTRKLYSPHCTCFSSPHVSCRMARDSGFEGRSYHSHPPGLRFCDLADIISTQKFQILRLYKNRKNRKNPNQPISFHLNQILMFLQSAAMRTNLHSAASSGWFNSFRDLFGTKSQKIHNKSDRDLYEFSTVLLHFWTSFCNERCTYQ